jgi:hypothetical protein
MKTLGDAILVRNRVIDALEVADNLVDEAERQAMLTVVVAGAGFAGVETIGAVNDLLREAMIFYPRLSEAMLRVVLVDPGDHILPELGESLGHYAEGRLVARGVEVRLGTRVGRGTTAGRWGRGIYLGKLPGVQKKVRVALDWALDMVFSKDLVQLPTVRSPALSEEEAVDPR